MLRQIHPDLMDGGEPSSSNFRPTPNDEGKLSVDRGSVTTPKDSHTSYLALGRASIGVYGITVEEFSQEEIPCLPDPLDESHEHGPNPAHALADFTGHGKSKQKTVAKRLKQNALKRGRLHPHSGSK